MTRFLRVGSFLLLLAISLLVAISCKKKDETIPDPIPNGTVDGTFTPAGSIQSIDAIIKGTSGGYGGGSPDPTGYFKMGVPEGDYVMTFTPKTGYNAPAPQSVHVTSGINTPLGTIAVSPTVPTSTVTSYPVQGTMSWQSSTYYAGNSGTYTNVAVTGTLIILSNGTPNGLTLKATGQNGTQEETLEMYVPNYGGPAQYTFNYASGYNYATYLNTTSGVVNSSLNTKLGGTAGTFTVTAHNLNARTLSGTFGYVATNTNNTSRATISSGTFSLSY